MGERIEKLGVDASLITELDWWEEHTIFPGDAVIHRYAGSALFRPRLEGSQRDALVVMGNHHSQQENLFLR